MQVLARCECTFNNRKSMVSRDCVREHDLPVLLITNKNYIINEFTYYK
jgi:hypothetical protein